MRFQKAVRKKSRLRLALVGPSGSGKTMGALMIAKGIGGQIALIDTERGSAALYAEPIKLAGGRIFEPPQFDVLELDPPYHPERFIQAVEAAERGGYAVCIIDSITHEWNGVGGCMELVDTLAATKFRGNTWSAFSAVTPRHRAFIDTLMRSQMHIIATMRSKTETAQVDEGGRKKVVKLGMKAEQREGAEYEFTTVLDLVHDGHFATASKDRTGLFSGDPQIITEETGVKLRSWLESGAEPVQEPKGSGVPPQQPAPQKPSQDAADALAQAKQTAANYEHALRVCATLPDLASVFAAAQRDIKKARAYIGAEAASALLTRIALAKDARKAELSAEHNTPPPSESQPDGEPAGEEHTHGAMI